MTLGCAALVVVWMWVDIPGVSDLSGHAQLTSGALVLALRAAPRCTGSVVC